ncbi:MAG: hypothetical protein O7J95_09955 [Planctomycetota bacterium]|nr:hypothetical protein [Planctomycetota bacterium]
MERQHCRPVLTSQSACRLVSALDATIRLDLTDVGLGVREPDSLPESSVRGR